MTRCLAVIVLTACASGCAVGPDYVRPSADDMPRYWREAGPGREVTGGPTAWWQSFRDPVLNQLIREAMLANLDLQQTYARIRSAREQRIVAMAEGLPIVTSKTSLSRRLNNAGQTGSGGLPGGTGFGSYTDIFQLGFDASWKVDLFGGIRRSVEAAQANLEAEVENSRDVLVTLLGDVAKYYIALRRAQRLLQVNRENLRIQTETAALLRTYQEAGMSDGLETAQAEALVEQTRAQAPVYETARRQARYELELLLGRKPGALGSLLESEQPIPTADEGPALDLPSELLRRRPDIRRAERQLSAATAQVGVATADLYPKFNIAAFVGLQNTKITDITALGKSWSTAASLTTPIFNWGKIQANIAAKNAQQEQTRLAYEAAVLGALKEIEQSLVAYVQEQQRCTHLEAAVASNRQALTYSQDRYLAGLASFLNVLDSQRELYSTETDWVECQAAVSENRVAVYKALGGGWEAAPVVSGTPPAGA